MPTSSMPRPRINLDSQPFWAGCRQHQLLLPFCEGCGKAHLPPGPVCPFCFSEQLAWRPASGRGVISSWVTVHKAWFPCFAGAVPYNVLQVELAEGPRLVASLAPGDDATPCVGDAVRVLFDDIDAELTLPRFERVPHQPP